MRENHAYENFQYDLEFLPYLEIYTFLKSKIGIWSTRFIIRLIYPKLPNLLAKDIIYKMPLSKYDDVYLFMDLVKTRYCRKTDSYQITEKKKYLIHNYENAYGIYDNCFAYTSLDPNIDFYFNYNLNRPISKWIFLPSDTPV